MKINVNDFIFCLLLLVLFVIGIIEDNYALIQIVLLFIIAREIIDIQKLLKK